MPPPALGGSAFQSCNALISDAPRTDANTTKRIVVIDNQRLVAAATAAAASTTATTRERRPFAGAAIAVRCGKHRKLNLVLLPRALRAGDLLLPIDHNFLKLVLAIFADVFVDRHCRPLSSQQLYQSRRHDM